MGQSVEQRIAKLREEINHHNFLYFSESRPQISDREFDRLMAGLLVLAATRGRGNVGDDITVNAKTIRSIPLSLRRDGAKEAPPEILEVRGEVYMDNEDFQRVNKELVEAGEEAYANARNLTSGT